jgi:phosphoglycolate phosphatase-like HAD superfamily hydrolase
MTAVGTAASAVVFDIDGTLIDSVDFHARAWQEALAHFGISVSFEDVRSQIGKGGDQLLPVFVPPDRLDALKDPIEAFRGELFKREYLPKIRPFPKVRELFERIASDGFRIGLASSAKEDEVGVYKRLARIADLVNAETSANDVNCSKPCPDVFEVAMNRLRVSPSRAIVVGDSPYDAVAAGRAGLGTVGVLCGGFPEEDLRQAGCVAIFRDPADILDRYAEFSSSAPLRPVRQTPASRSAP